MRRFAVAEVIGLSVLVGLSAGLGALAYVLNRQGRLPLSGPPAAGIPILLAMASVLYNMYAVIRAAVRLFAIVMPAWPEFQRFWEDERLQRWIFRATVSADAALLCVWLAVLLGLVAG